jgi:pyruvate-formate lyase-activating enzyme
VPVIPDFNDSERYMEELASALEKVPAEKISLLGYHEWGKPKYGALGRDYLLDGSTQLSQERLDALACVLSSRGLPVTVGY